eukprot:TRINITY_DN17020_c0_g1_i1.p1 TRINITY_DN17020_c0_g1~~TRINITY_DN17020_c0_g1_i1.p1  ORF type:complete len:65 (+),score=1.71 TRINITY_DN17020_c0_g1_i1:31-195(+)
MSPKSHSKFRIQRVFGASSLNEHNWNCIKYHLRRSESLNGVTIIILLIVGALCA